MAKVELPYVKRYRDRHGKLRFYLRRPGCKAIALPGDPLSREFMDAYHAAMDAAPRPRPIGASRTQPGTFDALLVQFYGSAEWAGLKANTQANYRHIYERFRTRFGHNLVAALDRKRLLALLDEKAATPGAARSFIKRMRTLLDFAVDRGYRADNPARTVKNPAATGPGFRAWTEADIAKFEARWPEGSRERLALTLLLYTAQRRSDVVTLGRQHLSGGKIHVLQLKGRKGRPRVRLAIPVHPALRRAIDALPKDNLTFLMTAFGKPFSEAGFTNWFSGAASEAGLPAGCTPHGLRKAAARRLAEAGCSAHQIAAITGHQTLAEVERYTRDVEQSRLADAAIEALKAVPSKPKKHKPGTGSV